MRLSAGDLQQKNWADSPRFGRQPSWRRRLQGVTLTPDETDGRAASGTAQAELIEPHRAQSSTADVPGKTLRKIRTIDTGVLRSISVLPASVQGSKAPDRQRRWPHKEEKRGDTMKMFACREATALWAAFVLSNCLVLGARHVAAESGILKVGAAKVDITPAADAVRPPTGKYAHEHLYIRAIVLDNSITRAALIAAELGGLSDPIWAEASRQVAAVLKCPVENILISATHTHSSSMPSAPSKPGEPPHPFLPRWNLWPAG
jgi:hypothetical protein